MTEEAAVTIAEIRTLVGERQRYDEWLAALEARRAETPVRVFERVHGDYMARRDGVIANLHEHVGTLESLEQDLNSRLHNLETQLAEREDERAEAMLRTAVGEFDAERWESTRHEVEASLAQLGQEREVLLAEAEDTRALLASARHRPAKPELAPAPEPAPVKAIAEAAPAESAPLAEAAAEVTAASVFADADADIEAAFAVNDAPTYEAGHPATHEYPGVASESPSASPLAAVEHDIDGDVDAAVNALDAAPGNGVAESLDNIDVFGDPNAKLRGNSPDSASRNGDARAREGRSARGSEAPAGGTTNGTTNGTTTRNDAFDDLAFLRSVTESGNGAAASNPTGRQGAQADQAKTLRCTECGTMNFPTEWYCERCGGELAAF
jgi:cell division septum initiation protein DivIVA